MNCSSLLTKYCIVFVILWLAVSSNALAQKSYFGYDAGIGLSNINSKNIIEKSPSMQVAYSVGGSFQKPILEFLNFRTGMQMQFKGDEFNSFEVVTLGSSGDFERLSYNLGYLSVPVAAQFHTNGKKVKWCSTIGVTGNVLFLNKAEVAEFTPCFIYDDTKLRRFGIGFIGSVGMEYQYFRNNKIYVEIRNNLDISNSVAKGPVPFYNQTIMLVVGHAHKLIF